MSSDSTLSDQAPDTKQASLRFSPAVLARLGEELVPNPDLGIIELVRNSYDADALSARVRLIDTDHPGGGIEVEDNGCGMSIDDIRDGWLLLGQSAKVSGPFTPGGRRKIGEKGLGRLAALRLGSSATLTTRESPTGEPGPAVREHSITVRWADFEDVVAVEQVQMDLVTVPCPPNTLSGTTVRVDGLNRPMTTKQLDSLARALVLLNGAFAADNTFRAELETPEFERLTEMVRDNYFSESEYRIIASLDELGHATAGMIDWRGELLASVAYDPAAAREFSPGSATDPRTALTSQSYDAPAATFELWAFLLGGDTWKLRDNRTSTVTELRKWLKHFGGVHIFQRGLRVHPYGDDGQDWLDMNLRRVRNPERRPGTNTSIGRVRVDDPDNRLVSKTDRSGFVENPAFIDLRRFCQDVLDWAADRQTYLRDEQRKRNTGRAQQRKQRATDSVRAKIADLPADVREPVEVAFDAFQDAAKEELQLVVDELKLYRTLSTVGTTTAVFAHETVRPVGLIEQMVGAIDRRLPKDVPEANLLWYRRPVDIALASASSLRTFAQLPLRLLAAEKRKSGIVDVSERVRSMLKHFKFYLDEAGVRNELALAADATISATVSEVEAIVANLLANSVHFLSTAPTNDGQPKRVLLVTEVDADAREVRLIVADNGPGIVGIHAEDVWLPGRTTREGGTGLGLTIVRDVVDDLRGTKAVTAHGRLGGAEFQLNLPYTPVTEPEQLVLGDT